MLAGKKFSTNEKVMAETWLFRNRTIKMVSKETILKALSCGGPLITVATQLDDIFVCMENQLNSMFSLWMTNNLAGLWKMVAKIM
jgi:hypothetical protein